MTGAEAQPPLALLLVDSHPLMREGLRAIAQPLGFIRVAAEAAGAQEAFALCRETAFDMAVVGQSLGDLGLIETVEGLRSRAPAMRLLVCYERLVPREAVALERRGVSGLVSRFACPRALVEALSEIAAGGVYRPGREAPALPAEGFALSAREAAVLRLLAQGFTNKDIAKTLSLSVRTVETHRFNLRHKSGASRPHELQRLAHRLGLFPPSYEDRAQRRVSNA